MRLSNRRVATYAMGAFGTGVFSSVPTVLLLYFCTQTLRMPPGLAAVVVFAPKIWAVIWDPMVGAISDRTKTHWGRRKPFLLVGAFGVSVAFTALFALPYPGGWDGFWWVAVIYFLLATLYSVFAVPFISVPAEISAVPSERERVAAWRIGVAMLGVLIGSGVAPALVQAGGGGRAGYAFMAWIVAAICGAGMLCAFLATPAELGAPAKAPPDLVTALRALWGARRFQNLILAYVAQLAAVGLISAMTPYWVIDICRRSEADVGLALGLQLAVTIAATPFWTLVVRRIGAGATTAAGAVLFGLCALGFLVTPATNSGLAGFVVFAVIGVPFAALQVGPFAFSAHLTHDASQASRSRLEALLTGLWTAGEKIGLALGPSLAGLGLLVTGFQTSAHVQSPDTLHAVRLLMALGPAALAAFSLVFLAGTRPAGRDIASVEQSLAA